MIPKARPSNSQFWFVSRMNDVLIKFGHEPWDGKGLIIFGCEGYYLNSMGEKNKNDRGIFDDAIAVISDRLFLTVNANLDPTKVRAGHGYGASKGMATIHYGVYPDAYAIGAHKAVFPALRQVGELEVRRDADNTVPQKDLIKVDDRLYYLERGNHQALNIHPAGINTTGSLGCQTIPRGLQWNLFIQAVVSESVRLMQKKFTYVKDRVQG